MAQQILMSSPFGQSLLDIPVVTSKYIPKGIFYMVDPSTPKPFDLDGILAQKQTNETLARVMDDLSNAYLYRTVVLPWSSRRSTSAGRPAPGWRRATTLRQSRLRRGW